MHAHCMPVHINNNKRNAYFLSVQIKETWNVALVCAVCIGQEFPHVLIGQEFPHVLGRSFHMYWAGVSTCRPIGQEFPHVGLLGRSLLGKYTGEGYPVLGRGGEGDYP